MVSYLCPDPNPQLRRYPFKAMGCPCELHIQLNSYPNSYPNSRIESQKCAALIIDEAKRLEKKYSRYRQDSITHNINKQAGKPEGLSIDKETSALLDFAETCFQQSGGLFDISSGVLRKVWDFQSELIPTQAQIDEILPLVGWRKIQRTQEKLTIPVKGMQVDFGGLVKEYCADRMVTIARSLGVHHGLIDLGGDIRIIGPQFDGSPWKVGIKDPNNPATAVAEIALEQGALASSGNYERCITHKGQRYSHILNPKTGWPVTGLTSVSVVAEQCVIAGSACTIAMLMDEKKAISWLQQLGLPYLTIDAALNISGSLSIL